jgi:drug/metabolite transporter (DMT)-like permease
MKHNLVRGATLLMTATFLTALVNALQKFTGARVPIFEVLFFRNAFSLPAILVIAQGGKAPIRTARIGGHIIRSAVGLTSMVMIMLAVTRLPLAEQQVFSYTQPFFLTIMAYPLLGERPGRGDWVAVAVGFLGVLVVASGKITGHGGVSMPLWVYGVALGQGAVGALTVMQIRQLLKTESSATIAFWQAILMSLFTVLALPFVWETPSRADTLWMVVIGLLAGVAQVVQTAAYGSAKVSSIGPFAYSGLLWAIPIGWFTFHNAPGLATLAGGALIVGSGVWMLRHDRQRQDKARAQEGAPQDTERFTPHASPIQKVKTCHGA